MDELNFYPFYINLFAANATGEQETKKDKDDKTNPDDEWQLEYELIYVSHQMESGW